MPKAGQLTVEKLQSVEIFYASVHLFLVSSNVLVDFGSFFLSLWSYWIGKKKLYGEMVNWEENREIFLLRSRGIIRCRSVIVVYLMITCAV